MVMLEKYGMYSVISDPLDEKLTEIAKGKRQDIVDLIYSMVGDDEPAVGGKDVNIAGLSKEMQEYAKTVNVILGKTLYSDSWLEI